MWYPLMIIAGLIMITGGFRLTGRSGKLWEVMGALLLPAGMILALLGVLLTAVPNFFKG